MGLKTQKRLAASVLGCSPKRIRFDTSRLEDIKESITKADIKNLITTKAIILYPKRGISRGRARKRRIQKIKGKRKGHGSRKGTKKTRTDKKRDWMNRVRLQRKFLKSLRAKNLISKKIYQTLYLRIKGGFFRSKKHISLYLDEHNLISKKS